MSPLSLFRRAAVAEAITWALLLVGMFLKYVTDTTDLGVRVFGMVHGVVFIAYCLAVVLVSVDQRWRTGRTLVGLLSAVPPFFTLWFERHVEKRDGVGTQWRLREAPARGLLELAVAWLVRNPALGATAGVVAVALLTSVALLVGPPASG